MKRIFLHALIDIFDRERPTHVIHQAAQISVRYSIENPLADAQTNILGTLNLLECCRKYKVEKIVYASSAAVYGQQNGILDEMATVKPASSYGFPKLLLKSIYNFMEILMVLTMLFCGMQMFMDLGRASRAMGGYGLIH